MPEATKDEDVRDRGVHRHGTGDPGKWDEGLNKTAREQMSQESTFATRKAARAAAAKNPAVKQIKSAEDKAVKGSTGK